MAISVESWRPTTFVPSSRVGLVVVWSISLGASACGGKVVFDSGGGGQGGAAVATVSHTGATTGKAQSSSAIAATSSASGTGGCDGTGSCIACTACAIQSTCAQIGDACASNIDCSALDSCIQHNCSGVALPSDSCTQKCFNSVNPEGVNLYLQRVQCTTCTVCQAACTSQLTWCLD